MGFTDALASKYLKTLSEIPLLVDEGLALSIRPLLHLKDSTCPSSAQLRHKERVVISSDQDLKERSP